MPEVARLAPMITRIRSPTLIRRRASVRPSRSSRRGGARRRHPVRGRADPEVLGRGDLGRRRNVVVFVSGAGGDLYLAGGRLDVAARDRQLDQPRPPLARGQVLDPELAVEGAQVSLDRIDAEEDRVGDLLVGRRGGKWVAPENGRQSAARMRTWVSVSRTSVGGSAAIGEVRCHCAIAAPRRAGSAAAAAPAVLLTSGRRGLRVGPDDHGVGDGDDLVDRQVGAARRARGSPPGSTPGRCRRCRPPRHPPRGRSCGSSGCRRTSPRPRPGSTAPRPPAALGRLPAAAPQDHIGIHRAPLLSLCTT